MKISMSSASLPVFKTMLSNLGHLLDLAQAHIEAKGIDPSVLPALRLYPDMLPFTFQVLIACDAAKLCVARLSGVDAPKFPDEEKTLVELKARVQKTLDYLATVAPETLDGTDEKTVTFPVGRSATRTLSGHDYLTTWVLPNMYFHITTAYAILRHNGVVIGKTDYLLGKSS